MDSSVRDRLSQWDSKLAPLSEKQKQGFIEISSAASYKPLPVERSVEPVKSTKVESADEKIKTAQDLLQWFDNVEEELESHQDQVYRDYCSHLEQYQSQCDQMISEVTSALDALNNMKEKHQFVSQKTQSLHDACEQLVLEETKLSNMTESITTRLSYFTELEQLGQKLNAPSFSLSPDTFPVLLARLDECIDFIQSHPHYKESPVYLARYRQQLSRALLSVKQLVTNTLKSTTQSILPSQVPKALGEDNYTQFYGKFRTNAPRIKALMKEIENRADKSAEYSTLLHDCLQCYCSQRSVLLFPSVTAAIQQLLQSHTSDYCGLLRSSCSFLSRVCLDEHQLFLHFFVAPYGELSDLILSLSNIVYEALRPVVVHVNPLETLTDMCSILKVEVIEDIVEPKGPELMSYGMVIKQLLCDLQQRLVFRAQRFIQVDIHGYNPSPGDLAYPDKLVVAAEAQAAMQGTETYSDNDSVFDVSESEPTTPDTSVELGAWRRPKGRSRRRGLTDLHAMWYPTVRRALLCLSKLYRCVERPVFEGLAQEALSECVYSLQYAATAIHAVKGQTDAKLFLIKHLLILREQIAAFNVSFSVREVYLDFTKTKNAAYSFLRKKSRMFSLSSNNAFLEFMFEGFPELIETQLDSKKEVDLRLKESCEQLITHFTSQLTQPLSALLSKFDVVSELASRDNKDLTVLIHQQPFAKAKDVHSVVMETTKLLKLRVPLIRRGLALYLSNEETESILFRPVKANVISTYCSLEKITQSHYSLEDRQIIACLTQQEVALLLSAPAAPILQQTQ